MVRLLQNLKLKRVMAILLLFVTVMPVFSLYNSKTANAASSANTIQRAYIAMMNGGQTTDSDLTSLASLEDLRLLSLFLSNAYIPFMSCLDGENAEDSMKVQEDFLVKLGFDPDTAEQVTRQVYSASLNSAKQIYIHKQDLPQDTDTDSNAYKSGLDMEDADGLSVCSTYTFKNKNYRSLVRDDFDNHDVEDGETLADDDYTPLTSFIFWTLRNTQETFNDTSTVTLYYIDDSGKKKECGELDKYTLALLGLALEDASAYLSAEGLPLGNSIFMNKEYTSSITNSSSGLSMDELNLRTNCSLFQNFYVDWVGNIFCDYGSSRRVIIPACMNKYAFSTVSTTLKNTSIGTVYQSTNKINGISVPFIKYASEGEVAGQTLTYKDSCINKASDFTYYLDSVSRDTISWDSTWGFWGTGTDGSIAEYLENTYGINTDKGTNVVDSDITFEFMLDDDESELYFKRNNVFSDFLVYKSIKVSTDTSDSELIKGDLYDGDNYLGKYFNQNVNFRSDSQGVLQLASFNGTSDSIMLQNIYMTYIYAYCNKDTTATSFDESVHKIDMKFCDKVFPELTGTLTWEVADTMPSKVMSMVYYILHPTEGIEYVTTLIKNKVSGFFIGWHEDMVGSTDSNYTTGMTQYLGFTGYTTVPNLNDVSWLAKLLSMYNVIVVYLLILMCVILLCYVLVGNITLQRGIIGLFMFGVMAFLPPIAISSVVNVTNRVSEGIYATKFDYWAINQTQGYLEELAKLESLDLSTSQGQKDYVSMLMSQKSVASSGEGGEEFTTYSGVKLKWMSPKKVSETAALYSEINDKITSSNSGLTSFTASVVARSANKNSAKEVYLSSDSATYLYRDYMDIYRYAAVTYNVTSTFNYNILRDLPVYATKGFSTSGINGYMLACWHASKFYKIQDETGVYGDYALKEIRTTSGDKLMDYVDSNLDSTTPVAGGDSYRMISRGIAEAIKGTSSLDAISRGFLVNTVGKSSVMGSNYYSKNTLATSLLMSYNECIMETYRRYVGLRNAYLGTSELVLDNVRFRNTSNWDVYFGLSNDYFLMSADTLVKEGSQMTSMTPAKKKQLHGLYYSLYSESPFYFLNYNVRDQLKALTTYSYNYKTPTNSELSVRDMFLQDNQSYFFNLTANAGDGYGELRDFMNMHDFFYYIMPSLKIGNDVVNLYDDLYGMSYDENVKLTFTENGGFVFQLHDGTICRTSTDLMKNFDKMTEEEKYGFWHNYNVRTIFNGYTPWLNMMYACDYADSETITVMGDKYVVSNPLDPSTYFKMDDTGKMISGRYMVFSRSEMAYYGLSWEDLTTVERKVITLQDNVYKNALELINYYTYSDETLIQAYSMLQLFEFNKIFSQTSLISEEFVLYPQSYELKAFTYDAYLRLILSNAGGDTIQYTSTSSGMNESIYSRIMSKTSILFGFVLVVNDAIAVYLLPALKLFFICFIFLLSIMMIVASATKMEFNLLNVVWKSLLAPLLTFGGTSIGLAFIVSLFMADGTNHVTTVTTPTISLGDPTMTLMVMLVLNVIVLVLYFKMCKKLWKDFITYTKAIGDNIGSAIVGTVGKAVGSVTGALAYGNTRRGINKVARNTAKTAKQRGRDNSPRSGKSGLGYGGAVAGGAIAGGIVGAATSDNKGRAGLNGVGSARAVNKYDAKSQSRVSSAENKRDKLLDKAAKADSKGNTSRSDKLLDRADKANATVNARKSYADDVAKLGKFGAQKKRAVNAVKTGTHKVAAKGKSAVNAVKSGDAGRKVGSSLGSAVNSTRSTLKNTKDGATRLAKNTATATRNLVNGTTARRVINKGKQAVNKVTSSGIDASKRAASGVVNAGRGIRDIAKKNLSYGLGAYRNKIAEGVAFV